MGQRVKAGTLLGLALLCLTACSEPESAQKSVPPQAEPISAAAEISHIAYNDFLSTYVAAPNGLYLLQNIYPASTSICYIDMQTQQEIFLCSDPNCTHDSDRCTSYLPVTDGFFSYSLAFYQDKLYLFRTTGTTEQPPALIELSLDGAERRTILELQSGESFYGRAFGSDGTILAEIQHLDENGNATLSLERIDLQNGEREKLLTYPTSSYYSAITTVGNQLVYVTNAGNASKTLLFMYDLNSGDDLAAAAEANALCKPYDGLEVSYVVHDPYLCGMTQADNQITCKNLLTGQEMSFTSPTAKSNEIVCGILPLYDQTFCLTIEKDETPVECLYDIETGELTGVEYPQTREKMNQLVAAFGDQLLIQQAIVERSLPNADQYGLVDAVCYLEQFSVVSKADFEAGVEGQMIELPAIR